MKQSGSPLIVQFLCPLAPKICQVNSQSLDYMENKVPVDLRGWVAVAESPHWFAWPNGPTTKNEH